jgi:hypothetical protein
MRCATLTPWSFHISAARSSQLVGFYLVADTIRYARYASAQTHLLREQLIGWLEHPDSRRGPVFPWARMGTAALLCAAAEVGLHVAGHWRHADREFVCVTTASGIHPVSETDRFEAAPCH